MDPKPTLNPVVNLAKADSLKDLEHQSDHFDPSEREEVGIGLIALAVIKIIFILFLSYGLYTVTNSPKLTWMFFDWANLMIHESGHFIFMAFGQFLTVAGGTITQLLVPAIIIIYFVLTQRWYSTFFGIFWIGDNLVNISSYMADARVQVMPLLALYGDNTIHDWNYLFSHTNLLAYDTVIAGVVRVLGIGLMVLALILMVGEVIFHLIKPPVKKPAPFFP